MGAGLEGELVEEGIFAVVGGPDGEVVAPGDAALGGLPEELGIGVFGEFVEADIAAIDGHGLGVGGEGDDAGVVVEFDVTDFDFFGEGGGEAGWVEAVDFEVLLSVRDDGAGEIEEIGEGFGLGDVFEGAGVIFGGEEVIAFGVAEALANVFKGVGPGPADADGFFCQGDGWFATGMEVFLGLNPIELVGEQVFGKERGGVEAEEREDGGHGGRAKG